MSATARKIDFPVISNDATFNPVSRSDFETVMGQIGFRQAAVEGVLELVYDRQIVVKGKPIEFDVRIFSSIDPNTGITKRKGEDAMRVVLWSRWYNNPIAVEKRVNRIGDPLPRLVDMPALSSKSSRTLWRRGGWMTLSPSPGR